MVSENDYFHMLFIYLFFSFFSLPYSAKYPPGSSYQDGSDEHQQFMFRANIGDVYPSGVQLWYMQMDFDGYMLQGCVNVMLGKIYTSMYIHI